jgi:CheY-like chemotaxis protein
LDLAKVEAGKLQFERVTFSLPELREEVRDLLKERAKAKGLYFNLEILDEFPSQISSDPTRLRQIFINIIGNALKFTSQGGVTVYLQKQELRPQHIKVMVTVKDTGVGISKEQQRNLFQPFVQADSSTTRKFGGTGLGLAVSHRLAEALGGEIKIQDCGQTDSGGCSFVITFVADVPKAVAAPVSHRPKATEPMEDSHLPLAQIKVLVVDDAPDNRFLVERILTKKGAIVETAKNGKEASRIGLKGDYDLIIMDLQMPEMDGYEAAKVLLESGFRRPIIALTAHAMVEERMKTRSAGFSYHLTKPIVAEELIRTVKQFGKAA